MSRREFCVVENGDMLLSVFSETCSGRHVSIHRSGRLSHTFMPSLPDKKQIEFSLTAEQLTTIRGWKLTQADLQEWARSQGIAALAEGTLKRWFTEPFARRAPGDIEKVRAMILGTGVGGGLVVDGRVLDGANGIAGEWGHNPLPWPCDDERPGPACYCGRAGCIETFLSGPGLARDHRRATGSDLAPREIIEGVNAGDAACEAALARYEERLARALAHAINLLDPDVIVLGGGLSNVDRLYATVPRLWGDWVFSDRVDTRLVPPMHGDASGVRGAAWLWNAGN